VRFDPRRASSVASQVKPGASCDACLKDKLIRCAELLHANDFPAFAAANFVVMVLKGIIQLVD